MTVEIRTYATCQGRPSAIRLEDLNLPYPSSESVGPRHQLLAAFVDISTILDGMIAILNKPDLMEQEAMLNSLAEIAEKLLSWLQTMPVELRWPTQHSPSPGICALHMHVLAAMILIHRPFAGYKDLLSESSNRMGHLTQLPGYTSATSKAICTQNSMRLSKMLDIFRQKHGITKIFSMGTWLAQTAGMSLMLELASPPSPGIDKNKVKKAIDICEEVLRDLSDSLPLARKHRLVMLSLCEPPNSRTAFGSERAKSTPTAPTFAQALASTTTEQLHTQRQTADLSGKHVADEIGSDHSWLLTQFGELPRFLGGYQNYTSQPVGAAPNDLAANMVSALEPGCHSRNASAIESSQEPDANLQTYASQPFLENPLYQHMAGTEHHADPNADFDFSPWSFSDFTDTSCNFDIGRL